MKILKLRFTVNLETVSHKKYGFSWQESGQNSAGNTLKLTENTAPGKIFSTSKKTVQRRFGHSGTIYDPLTAPRKLADFVCTPQKSFLRLTTKSAKKSFLHFWRFFFSARGGAINLEPFRKLSHRHFSSKTIRHYNWLNIRLANKILIPIPIPTPIIYK